MFRQHLLRDTKQLFSVFFFLTETAQYDKADQVKGLKSFYDSRVDKVTIRTVSNR